MEVEITKMTSRGQVVIPQDIREKEGFKEGEKFLVVDIGGSLLLKRVKNLEARNIDQFENAFRSLWKTAKMKGLAESDAEKEVAAHRKERRST